MRCLPKRAHLHASWLALAVIAAAISLGSAAPAVRFIEPQPGDVLIGESQLALQLDGISDQRVEAVRILLDAREIGTLTEPPWRLTFDAGDDVTSHELMAIVRLKDGTTHRGRLTIDPVGVDRVDVRLVDLAVTVNDASGAPVLDLERDDFRVFDEGRRVSIDRWAATPAWLAATLVIDTSLSMQGEKMEDAREAAEDFLRRLEDEDEASLLAFDDVAKILTPMAKDREPAIRAVRRLEAEGGTALYDALYRAAENLGETSSRARRVVLLLSDGRDEAASGLEPGSFHTLKEAVKVAHDKNVVVFTIGVGHALDEERDFTGRHTTEEILKKVATSTGGRYLSVGSSRALRKSFREILEELRHQYQIAYEPPPAVQGETWRSVRVEVERPDVEVRTRDGYYVN